MKWVMAATFGLVANLAALGSACGTLLVEFSEAERDAGPAPDSVPLPDGVTALCGNDIIDEGEACDDGNDVGGDGCEPECRTTFTSSGEASYLDSSPADVSSGALESSEIYLIRERHNEVLAFDLPIDATPSRVVDGDTDEQRYVPAGSRVHVYLVHFEAVPKLEGQGVSATFAFDKPILGVISRNDSLIASDLAGITYAILSGRPIEVHDLVVLEERRLEVTLANSGYVDELRVVVATETPHNIVLGAFSSGQ